MREQLVAKMRPDRFTAMSGKMAAIVGYILDERLTDPAVTYMVVTSDGFVLAQAEGDDYQLRLSPKRLAELQAEMDALIERYRNPDPDDADAIHVEVHVRAFPLDPTPR